MFILLPKTSFFQNKKSTFELNKLKTIVDKVTSNYMHNKIHYASNSFYQVIYGPTLK